MGSVSRESVSCNPATSTATPEVVMCNQTTLNPKQKYAQAYTSCVLQCRFAFAVTVSSGWPKYDASVHCPVMDVYPEKSETCAFHIWDAFPLSFPPKFSILVACNTKHVLIVFLNMIQNNSLS